MGHNAGEKQALAYTVKNRPGGGERSAGRHMGIGGDMYGQKDKDRQSSHTLDDNGFVLLFILQGSSVVEKEKHDQACQRMERKGACRDIGKGFAMIK